MRVAPHWLVTIAIVMVVWTGVALVMRSTEDRVSSPAKVIFLLQDAPWYADANLASAQRQAHLDKVLIHFTRLDLAQRREVREEGQAGLDRFVASLTADEQNRFAEGLTAAPLATVSKGLRAMPAAERKQMAERIRRDMIARSADHPERVPSAADLQLMLDVGLDVFFKDAKPAEKLRLAPMLEDMQSRIQGMRR